MKSQSQTIQQRRMEILEWEKTNRNLTNRNQKNGLSCLYTPLPGKPFGCAVGRLLTDRSVAEALDQMPESSVSRPDIFKMLPQDVKDLGLPFLRDLQTLHDVDDYWTNEGLSEDGMHYFESIIRIHCK